MRIECIAFVVLLTSTFLCKGSYSLKPPPGEGSSGENRRSKRIDENEDKTYKFETKRNEDDSVGVFSDDSAAFDGGDDSGHDLEIINITTEPYTDLEYDSDAEAITIEGSKREADERSTESSSMVSRSMENNSKDVRNFNKPLPVFIPSKTDPGTFTNTAFTDTSTSFINANSKHRTEIEAEETSNSSPTTIISQLQRLIEKLISDDMISELEDDKQYPVSKDKLSCTYNGKPLDNDDENVEQAFEDLLENLRVQYQSRRSVHQSSLTATCPIMKRVIKSLNYLGDSYEKLKEMVIEKSEEGFKKCPITYDIQEILQAQFHISKMLENKINYQYSLYKKVKESLDYESNIYETYDPYLNYDDMINTKKDINKKKTFDSLEELSRADYNSIVLMPMETHLKAGESPEKIPMVRNTNVSNPKNTKLANNQSSTNPNETHRGINDSHRISEQDKNNTKPQSQKGNSKNEFNITPRHQIWVPTELKQNWTPLKGRQNWTPPKGRKNWTPPKGRQNWMPPKGRQNWTPHKGRQNWTPLKGRQNWTPPKGRQNWMPPKGRQNWTPLKGRQNWTPLKGRRQNWLHEKGRRKKIKGRKSKPRIYALLPPTQNGSNLEEQLMRSLSKDYFIPMPMKLFIKAMKKIS